MTRPVRGKYSFEEFRKLVAEELLVDEEEITPKTSFSTDLRMDSVRMVDMMLRLEEQGIRIPWEAGSQIVTVGDAYRFYLEGASTPARSGEWRRDEQCPKIVAFPHLSMLSHEQCEIIHRASLEILRCTKVKVYCEGALAWGLGPRRSRKDAKATKGFRAFRVLSCVSRSKHPRIGV
jgi:acyl carrier protein